MTLDELKARLGMHAEESPRDAQLQYFLDDAIAFVEAECNTPLARLPTTVNAVIMRYVQYELLGTAGVLSETIGGMTQSFESAEARNKALSSELAKLGLRQIRFTSLGGRW